MRGTSEIGFAVIATTPEAAWLGMEAIRLNLVGKGLRVHDTETADDEIVFSRTEELICKFCKR